MESLHRVLADSYTLYLKTQNYHWNVTGPHFKSLHELFEEQYIDLAKAIDDIAERIRILGEKAPGSFAAFAKLTSIKDGDQYATASDMVSQLRDDQEIVILSLKEALKHAQETDDEGTVALVGERISAHEKHHWVLASSI